jgi:hypothetical protein
MKPPGVRIDGAEHERRIDDGHLRLSAARRASRNASGGSRLGVRAAIVDLTQRQEPETPAAH